RIRRIHISHAQLGVTDRQNCSNIYNSKNDLKLMGYKIKGKQDIIRKLITQLKNWNFYINIIIWVD
ncbi:hypothetical protein HZS_79, partial [Henneguya salminicola]